VELKLETTKSQLTEKSRAKRILLFRAVSRKCPTEEEAKEEEEPKAEAGKEELTT